MLRAAVASAVAFLAVSVAVVEGAFTGIDQWALDHAMPWLSPVTHAQTIESIVVPFHEWTPGGEIPLALWTYPASVPVSALLLALGCAILWRRGLHAAALAWAAAWIVGDAVEVIGKGLLDRPTLHMTWHGVRTALPGFDDSFPSGHTLRGLLVAAVVGTVWPRARVAAAIWVVATCVFLVVTSAHTPSDVLGGALLAAALGLPALQLGRTRETAALRR